MVKHSNTVNVPDELVLTKIFMIRGLKVMVDRDLAELYGVETKRLKEAVRRNSERFPEDFMFEMTREEFDDWRTQIATSNSDKMGLRYLPFCFTEQGVTMLSCILNSDRAIKVNIQIIRIFSKMRDLLISNSDILNKLLELESKTLDHDKRIKLILNYINLFREIKAKEEGFKSRQRIGFKK